MIPAILLVTAAITLVHMNDHPELDNWMSGLKIPGSSATCCSSIDGSTLAAEDYFSLDEARPEDVAKCRLTTYRMPGQQEKNSYCVHLFDQWWLVPERAVLLEPNKYGQAIVWGSWGWETVDGVSRKTVSFFRCFMPGAGT